ncbi:penicillin-binding protein 2 [Myxococcota bacterium]|nr:penicillin-binding protein 2 [Myxococcota bacterium]MBU1412801.1 penicillin-binding protein 2 [Myxococcota bacterium]MBU1509050.1 penicillin-binding protein 2 [Myxococcota bacterium]
MRRLVLSDDSEFGRKYRIAFVFVGVVFLVLIGRLAQLQIVYGAEYRELSRTNFLQKINLEAPRGLILDRHGAVLVKNRVAYNVFITPRFFNAKAFETLQNLIQVPQVDLDYIQSKIMLAEGRKRGFSLLAIRDVPKEWALILESNRDHLPGLDISTQEKRQYPNGPMAAHALGFVGEVGAEDILRQPLADYHDRDWIGKFGLESKMEKSLRGRRGSLWRVRDAKGRIKTGADAMRWLPRPFHVPAQPGYNVVSTIDADIQRAVELVMAPFVAGSAVLMEVDTGKVLAYVSKPAFDPNEVSGRLSSTRASEIYNNPLYPMLDKVIQGTYFPGSTYKVVSVIAAIEENLVEFEEYHLCKGWYEYGRSSSFRCTHAHGLMNLESAVVSSCNVYFYMLSERVGMDRMARYARLLGFGTPPGLDLNHEKSGFIPTKQWYAQKYQEGFRIGHTLNSGIGQGDVKASILQVAQAYGAIANRGSVMEPQLVERITDYRGATVQEFMPVVKRRLEFKPETWDLLIRALDGVVNSPEGTAYKARLSHLRVAGKTGTAQVRAMRREPGQDPEESRWRNQDHAWFVGFSPVEKPQVVVVVLVEHGGFASKMSVAPAMAILDEYFKITGAQNQATP